MKKIILFIIIVFYHSNIFSQEIYQLPLKTVTRWISPENKEGLKGKGGRENKGAKGKPFENIKVGQSLVLFSVKGTGIINRIWLTLNDRSPKMLRSLKIEMFWDNALKPAVSAPLGDFFCSGLGKPSAFENDFFASPEGRSFICYIPMPFRTAAKIVITNESEKDLKYIFYDVDYILKDKLEPNTMYFHCYWNREVKTKMGKDFEIMPKVNGSGRFLGANFCVIADSIYENTWWGEGEVKIYMDGDIDNPTLNGTGTEDYIGTGWGQGRFVNRFSGCLLADPKTRQYSFYRLHIPDPVYFQKECKVTIQQMGGDFKEKVLDFQKKKIHLIPVTIDSKDSMNLLNLLERDENADLSSEGFPTGWTNFYRQDDWSATAYFYLNSNVNNLPPLAPVSLRVEGTK